MKNFGSNAVKAFKTNLQGTFSWNKYIERGNHDHKFGPNKFDFIAQIPLIGIGFCAIIFSLIFIVGFPIKTYMNLTGKRK